jgi:hypothetical protein
MGTVLLSHNYVTEEPSPCHLSYYIIKIILYIYHRFNSATDFTNTVILSHGTKRLALQSNLVKHIGGIYMDNFVNFIFKCYHLFCLFYSLLSYAII